MIDRRRIAIVFWETYLGCAPSIINAARVLAERGYVVDVLIRQQNARIVPPPELGDRIQVRAVGNETADSAFRSVSNAGSSNSVRPLWKRMLPTSIRQWGGRTLDAIKKRWESRRHKNRFAFESYCEAISEYHTEFEPNFVIGVDTLGLVAADQAAGTQFQPGIGSKVLYWSLEIMRDQDFSDATGRLRKQQEREAHRRAAALIIPDAERAEAINMENGVSDVPVIVVPNSPRGVMTDHPEPGFLHQRLQLPLDFKLILHAGSICEGMRSDDLAISAAQWPEPYRLVFHTHTRLSRHDSIATRVVEEGRGRVVLSNDPVDYDRLDDLVSSARISLVIYDSSLGVNFQLLAGASGKLAHSLRCGIPVICIDNPSIQRVLHANRCGIGVSHPQEIWDAIQTIEADYDAFSQAARDCFQHEYEFDSHFEAVMRWLDANA